MTPQLLTYILIALGLVVLSAIVLIAILSLPPAEFRALNRAWGDIARRSRLRYTPPKQSLEDARLHGIYRQREVASAVRTRTAFRYSLDGKKEFHYYTRLEAYVRNPERYYLRLTTRGGYRKTDQYLAQPVRPLEDRQIDARYDIKCIPHDLAVRLIPASKSLRERFLALRGDRYVEIELEANAVRLEQEGVEQDARYLLALFDTLCDFGEAFEKLA